mgnify:CR=1 FL=1
MREGAGDNRQVADLEALGLLVEEKKHKLQVPRGDDHPAFGSRASVDTQLSVVVRRRFRYGDTVFDVGANIGFFSASVGLAAPAVVAAIPGGR